MEDADIESKKIIRIPGESYSSEPREGAERSFSYVEFGNTGLRLDFYRDVWAMTFSGVYSDRPVRREEIYTNGLLFVWGLYASVEWFEKRGVVFDKTGKGLVRNDTNERMYRFRSKLLDELAREAGTGEIYREIGRFNDNYEYELRYDRLTEAVREIEKTCSPEERREIRFFKLLEEVKRQFS